MIIGLSGYAKSGKDTVAEMIKEIQPETWQIKKFSGKLKQIASILTGIPEVKFEDQSFKESELGSEWDVILEGNGHTMPLSFTVREFLQRLGTDAVRDGLHRDAWVNALMADYMPVNKPDMVLDNGVKVYDASSEEFAMPNWIVTDVRFPNEAKAIKERGGMIVRVHRGGIKPVNPHVSEIALDKWAFDYILDNDSDLDFLKQSVESFLKNIS